MEAEFFFAVLFLRITVASVVIPLKHSFEFKC